MSQRLLQGGGGRLLQGGGKRLLEGLPIAPATGNCPYDGVVPFDSPLEPFDCSGVSVITSCPFDGVVPFDSPLEPFDCSGVTPPVGQGQGGYDWPGRFALARKRRRQKDIDIAVALLLLTRRR